MRTNVPYFVINLAGASTTTVAAVAIGADLASGYTCPCYTAAINLT